MAVYGYSGKILRVDLSSGRASSVSTLDYAGGFLGGRGIAARIYWDEVPPEADSTAPETSFVVPQAVKGDVAMTMRHTEGSDLDLPVLASAVSRRRPSAAAR